jgi:hypothetical protein
MNYVNVGVYETSQRRPPITKPFPAHQLFRFPCAADDRYLQIRSGHVDRTALIAPA